MGQGSREEREPSISGESPGQRKEARRGTGTPSGGKVSAGQRGARDLTCRGPHGARMGGAVRQQVCVTCGARMGRLELARVLGQRREAPRRRETSLGLQQGYFPTLSLSNLQAAGRAFSTARIPPSAKALLRACHRTNALRASHLVWIPDARQVLLWGDPLRTCRSYAPAP